jgi:iron complex outermembrane receptor protein
VRLVAALLLGCVTLPAQAAGAVDVPGGRLGDAVVLLSRQTGISVSIDGAKLADRRVSAVRGRLSPRGALTAMLRGIDAEVSGSGDSYRIVALRRRSVALRRRSVATAAIPVILPEGDAIVVTASKRDTRLRDYAGMVGIIDGQDLMFGGERGTASIMARSANVTSTYLGSGRNKLFIRGVADSSFTGPTQATVGQYFNDVRLAYNAPDPDLRMVDIASVEILEGPQGTIYGAGSLGGIIRVISNVPSFSGASASASAGASATQHGAASGDFGATFNLPVSDHVAVRAVGYGLSDGGYIDDTGRNLKDVNSTRVFGGRGAVRVDPGDGWMVDLIGLYQSTEGDDSQYADIGARPLTRSSKLAQDFSSDYWLGEAVIAKQWDDIRFQTATALVRQDLAESFDASVQSVAPDGATGSTPTSVSDGPTRLFRQRNRTTLVSNESRLWRPMMNGFGWIVGGSFIHNATRLSRALGAPDLPAPVTGVANRLTEFTVYGEGSLMILPGLTATVGGRVSTSRITGGAEDVPLPVTMARVAIVANRNETSVSPSFAVNAVVMPGLNMFMRYQQGFRPGGLAVEGDFVRRFRRDKVASIEAGLRYGESEHDPLGLSASVSNTRWTDIQADFVDGSGLPSTANIGDGRIWSVTGAASWRPMIGLRLEASAAYNDSRVTDPTPQFAMFLSAGQMKRIPNIAGFAARGLVEYRATFASGLQLRTEASARYIGRSRLGIGPVLGEQQGNYLDTSLTVRVGRPNFGVTLGLTNLADSIGNRFALGTPFDLSQGGQVTPLRPRTLRIGFDAAF